MRYYRLNDLKEQVKKTIDKTAGRRRARYAFAKALGFDPEEARILMFKSEDVIKRLAEEKAVAKIPEDS